jgi:hypothetical protein
MNTAEIDKVRYNLLSELDDEDNEDNEHFAMLYNWINRKAQSTH